MSSDKSWCALTLLHVWEQDLQVVHEVPHAMVDSSRGEHEHSLLVPGLLRRRGTLLLVDLHVVRLALALRIGFLDAFLLEQ